MRVGEHSGYAGSALTTRKFANWIIEVIYEAVYLSGCESNCEVSRACPSFIRYNRTKKTCRCVNQKHPLVNVYYGKALAVFGPNCANCELTISSQNIKHLDPKF